MYAIRKPCYPVLFLDTSVSYKVSEINKDDNNIILDDYGVWDLDRFILVDTLEQANKILSIIKESK